MKSFIFRAIQKSPIYVSVGSSYRIIGGRVEFSVNVSMKDGRSWTVMTPSSWGCGSLCPWARAPTSPTVSLSSIWGPSCPAWLKHIDFAISFSAIFVTVNDWSANYYYHCMNSSCMIYTSSKNKKLAIDNSTRGSVFEFSCRSTIKFFAAGKI